jgi:hypothetical protein
MQDKKGKSISLKRRCYYLIVGGRSFIVGAISCINKKASPKREAFVMQSRSIALALLPERVKTIAAVFLDHIHSGICLELRV